METYKEPLLFSHLYCIIPLQSDEYKHMYVLVNKAIKLHLFTLPLAHSIVNKRRY